MRNILLAATTVLGFALTAPAFADDNSVFISQTASSAFASQDVSGGAFNTATINQLETSLGVQTITGNANITNLTQTGGAGNLAYATIAGSNNNTINQTQYNGTFNVTSALITGGSYNNLSSFQTGTLNTATQTVTASTNNNLSVIQVGAGNQAYQRVH